MNNLANLLLKYVLLLIVLITIAWGSLSYQIEQIKPTEQVTVYIENTDTISVEKQGWYLSRDAHRELLPSERKELIYEFHLGYHDLIDSICRLNNVPTELGIARSIRESRYNTTTSSVLDYNLFGIHWIKSMKQFEYSTYKDTDAHGHVKLYKFVKYKSYAESIQHFCDFIKAERYAKHLYKTEKTLEDYAKALCLGGYSVRCAPQDDINAWRYYNNVISNISTETYGQSDTIH